MKWKRVFALLSHNYGFSIDQIMDMTVYQIEAYISQIWYVSPLERIRYYIRNILAIMLKWLCDQELPVELEEDETLEAHKERELEEIQRMAKLADIDPPDSY